MAKPAVPTTPYSQTRIDYIAASTKQDAAPTISPTQQPATHNRSYTAEGKRSPRKGSGKTCGAGSPREPAQRDTNNHPTPHKPHMITNPAAPLLLSPIYFLLPPITRTHQNPARRIRQNPTDSANLRQPATIPKIQLAQPKKRVNTYLRLRCSQGTLDDARSDPGDRSPGGTKVPV